LTAGIFDMQESVLSRVQQEHSTKYFVRKSK
jgi:hypothetical protein